MTKDVIKVVFRVWSDGSNDVFALFPNLPADHNGHCTCYEHVGQHGAADYDHCIVMSRPATLEEYTALANELKLIGYQLQIRGHR